MALGLSSCVCFCNATAIQERAGEGSSIFHIPYCDLYGRDERPSAAGIRTTASSAQIPSLCSAASCAPWGTAGLRRITCNARDTTIQGTRIMGNLAKTSSVKFVRQLLNNSRCCPEVSLVDQGGSRVGTSTSRPTPRSACCSCSIPVRVKFRNSRVPFTRH
jgi:hypothetical protein